MDLAGALYELIIRTSTTLPDDVRSALDRARSREDEGSLGAKTLDVVLENARLAADKKVPLCQDTGTINFFVKKPAGFSETEIKSAVVDSVRDATAGGFLRPNAVDPVSGVNSGDNTGAGSPQIYFELWEDNALRFDLLLKGGGSENVGVQYSLPDERLNAGRDLDGIRMCALDAVFRAQGLGCPPGVLAVAVGGDRAAGYAAAKKLFFGKIGERTRGGLGGLEETILAQANGLGIGPSGLGGKTTLLDVKACALHRNPPSYFVTVSYGCWALRRRSMTYRDGVVEYD